MMDAIAVIQNKIIEVRGQKVILDSDIAKLYGVETRVLKQAVNRNIERFPPDFMFELNDSEFAYLKQVQRPASSGRGGSRYKPYAFTEQGVAMLSSVLSSPAAIQVNINIVRAFVEMRSFINRAVLNPVLQLEDEVRKLKKYVEEAFEDYNDINEDTRIQLECINEAIAELQAEKKKQAPRKRIGF